jgi:uncharacterized membrane protein
MFRLVSRGRPETPFSLKARRIDIWFTPVMAVLFVIFLTSTPLAFATRGGETRYVLSIFSGSLLLALIFTCALFHFVGNIARSSDVDAELNDILKALRRAISRRNCSRPDAVTASEVMETTPESFLLAPESGYLQQVDYPGLSEAAARVSAVIHVLCRPGDFVLKESPVASVCFAGNDAPSDLVVENLQHQFARAASVSKERSIKYDADYAIVRITGIATICMSPSFADPVATLSCINALTIALREILCAPLKRQVHCDSMGQPRIFEKETPPERVLSSAFDPLRPIVKNSVALSVYLLQAISALAPFLNTPAQFLELRAQAELIHDAACLDASERDGSAIDEAYLSARQSLSCPTRVVEKIAPHAWQRPGLSQTAS